MIALGRTGSTHLLRVLNSVPGYRISGETDNAWIHMGWFAHARLDAGVDAEGGFTKRSAVNGKNNATAFTFTNPAIENSDLLCDLRQMMLLIHNPLPRARYPFQPLYVPAVSHLVTWTWPAALNRSNVSRTSTPTPRPCVFQSGRTVTLGDCTHPATQPSPAQPNPISHLMRSQEHC